MTPEHEIAPPLFEIDQPEIFHDYFLSRLSEVVACLKNLQNHQALVTIYIDAGHNFFISSILSIDQETGVFVLDAANSERTMRLVNAAKRLILTTTLDKVKIQIRSEVCKSFIFEGKPALQLPLPKTLLRLQRREFFRLEIFDSNPLSCKLAHQHDDDSTTLLNLRLLDISEGGISLRASLKQAEHFPSGQIFQDCRLEIPGEGFIPVHLCVKKTSTIDSGNESPLIRVGCEFINLPASRMAQIQRYITRTERERKARKSS